jgi:hypothetical protein
MRRPSSSPGFRLGSELGLRAVEDGARGLDAPGLRIGDASGDR